MNLEQAYKQVVEFQVFFDFQMNDITLRKSLIKEETTELLFAKNQIDKLDGYLDSIYVVLGTFHNLEYGFENNNPIGYEAELHDTLINLVLAMEIDFPETNYDLAFTEVHNSNMSKSCDTLETVHRTIANRPSENLHHKIHNGKYFVRNEENKLIKSIDYKPADLTKFI